MTIYKTLYNADNTAAEYQKRGKDWFKRKKGSEEPWKKVESKYYANLNAQYKKSGFLYNYTTASKIIAGTLLAFIVFKLVKK
jgi:hypothetical protein